MTGPLPLPAEPLPFAEALDTDAGLKQCCAAIYSHPGVRWLLGDELHPGGAATTRRGLELAEAGPGDRLLDVASGAGASAILAAREFGCEVTGIEYGERSVAEASAAARAAGLGGHVGFHCGDAEALPFPSASFDVVLCECSLCTFPDKAKAASELERVLRPGGRLVLSDVIADRARLPAELLGPASTVACVGAALSLDGYNDVLSEAGLQTVQVEDCSADAEALATRIHDRLRGARLLGFDGFEGAPLTTSDAIDLLATARRAIADGALGYAIIVAVKAEA